MSDVSTAASLPSIDTIKRLACAEFGVSLIDLESERRDRPTVRARWAVMLLARERTAHATPTIGRHVGRRDHTTVLDGLRRAAELQKSDAIFLARITSLRRRLDLLARPGSVAADQHVAVNVRSEEQEGMTLSCSAADAFPQP